MAVKLGSIDLRTASGLKLASGLVLFVFLATHLVNHGLGLVSLAAMEAGRQVFLAVWRNPVGTSVLIASSLVHMALVLHGLYRRRSLRALPRTEAVQILLGFAVPPLLVLHFVATRGVNSAFGVNDSYAYVVLSLWVWDPLAGIKQVLLVLVAWLHGAIGVHHWLRFRPWYPRWAPWLLAAAVLLPVLALTGFMSGGREAEALMQDPAWMAAYRESVAWPGDEARIWVYAVRDAVYWGMTALIVALGAARSLRLAWERRKGMIAITYPDGRRVVVPPGTTVLEASRLNGIPHASVCGGRGRCSTCRVRVHGGGGDVLAPPSPEELRVLRQVAAPEGVRLACQIRPAGDIRVTPLLAAGAQPGDAHARAARLAGGEREIAVLFADLRAFTKFAETRLPYDVVFVLNQYFRAMGRAVEGAGGRIDKFIGDGVMALFGLESGPEQGCREAIDGARAMAAALDDLNRALEPELAEPLRIGIGIHVGPAIVGEMGYGRSVSVTAIGDTVNTASRLEVMTKEFGCQLVLSRRVARRAGVDLDAFDRHRVEVRGRVRPLAVYVVPEARDLPEAVAPPASA